AQPPKSRPRRALRESHRQGCAGNQLPRAGGERAAVSLQRYFVGGRKHQQLPAPGVQELDGVVRLHRRRTSLGVLGGAIGKAPARSGRGGGGRNASRAGEVRQMKAMILAAGLGTRLRPLTNDRPKALVEIDGRTLLEITLCRLRAFGIRDVIVNVHHFADMVLDYLKANDKFGMGIEVSREDVLL